MSDSSPSPSAEQSHATKGLLRLTMACNERCPFCNVPAEDYRRPTPPADEVEAQLEAFVATGQQTLTISGGEPTLLRKRLLALVAQARGRGIPFVELQTNAVLIDAPYAQELAGAGLTSAFVSLLAHEPALHDMMAGLDGAFPRCLAGIDHLLASGVRVTLNPVFGLATQHTVADYVDFVAARLPGVRSISLSAVQPHGRARQDLDGLLPDYAVLGPQVVEARKRADAHGIELLNPYCGLPLCAGWRGGEACSVEAFEAESEQGEDQGRPGIDNSGNKAHGLPCRDCALRTRCGGAWHAYWQLRDGSGLQAPVRAVPPWEPGFDQAAEQCRVGQGTAPTVWGESLGDLGGVTDLALTVPAAALDPLGQPDRAMIKALRRLDLLDAERAPQHRLRTWLRLAPETAAQAERVLELCTRLGVHAVALAGPVAAHRLALARLFPALHLLDAG